MTNEHQWIPLTGPGGRLPTEADSSDASSVHVVLTTRGKLEKAVMHFEDVLSDPSRVLYWAPIPKAPPLPKPVELSQEEKDLNAAREIYSAGTVMDDIVSGIRYGRSDGRAQLAREALAVFKEEFEWRYQDGGITKYWPKEPDSANKLRELLTQAAEEKPCTK